MQQRHCDRCLILVGQSSDRWENRPIVVGKSSDVVNGWFVLDKKTLSKGLVKEFTEGGNKLIVNHIYSSINILTFEALLYMLKS